MSPAIAVHLAGAILALVLGAVMLIRAKGTASHRFLGRIWVVVIVVVAAGSFGIHTIRPGSFSLIHLLSAWTLFAVAVGYVAIRRHNVRLHRGFMIGTFIGLVAAGLFALAPGRLLGRFLAGLLGAG